MANTKRQYNSKKAKSVRDLSFNQMAKDFRTPALVIAGMTIANVGIKQLNKVLDKQSVSGLLGVDSKTLKKYIAPTISVVTGLGVYQLIPNPDVKVIGLGIATKGGIMALKEISGKDILSGLDGMEGVGNALSESASSPVLIEQVNEPVASPLDLPLYEINEPANSAFSRLMETDPESSSNSMQGYPSQQGPAKEIILNSQLDKDNITDKEQDNDFDTEKNDLDITGTEGVISGEITTTMAAPQTVVQDKIAYPTTLMEEPEEVLDFLEIP